MTWGWAHVGTGTGSLMAVFLNTVSTASFSLFKTSTSEAALYAGSQGTLLATSSTGGCLSGSGWHYVEVQHDYVNSTTSNFTVRVDGVVVISGSFVVNTNTSAVGYANIGQGNFGVMDFYCLNSSGSVNNTFLGDCRVEHLVPTSEGADTGWALGAGSSKTAAMTAPTDADASYIRTTTANNRQGFVMSDLASTGGTPKGVTVLADARAETNSVQKLAGMVRSGGTSADSTTYMNPPNVTTYGALANSFDVNPVTGVAWTAADINALEAGVVVLP